MTPSEIAQWMREEHAVVEELATRLHDRVAIVPRNNVKQWIEEVRNQVEGFRSHIRKHFNLEDEGGYLQAVMERRPTLAREVDRLHHEHDELDRVLDSILDDLRATGESDRILIGDCCARIENLLRYLKDHEDRENLMVISVFTNDLGTKD